METKLNPAWPFLIAKAILSTELAPIYMRTMALLRFGRPCTVLLTKEKGGLK